MDLAILGSLPNCFMPNFLLERSTPVATGLGVATAFGFGVDSFRTALYSPSPIFKTMQRPGRQLPGGRSAFVGAEIPEVRDPLPPRISRTTGLTGRVTVAVVQEAWRDAGLDDVDPDQIGLIIGGSNVQTREQLLLQDVQTEKLRFLSPQLGYRFMDTDLCGLCTSVFPIRGFAYAVGAASASGLLAIQHAAAAVQVGRVQACIAVGALQDLSYVELQALRSLGAMGSDRFAEMPDQACRPFDRDRDGFIFGECSAAIVFRRLDQVNRSAGIYGAITGSAHVADGNRGPEPSLSGEVRAIRRAIGQAGLRPEDVDYVNAHGTGSPAGDDTEVAAFRESGLVNARINATKSIVGHGLSAAGAVELAAVFLQMRDQRLHATRNLDHPIAPELLWMGREPESVGFRNALKVSFGFGGIDTAVVVQPVQGR